MTRTVLLLILGMTTILAGLAAGAPRNPEQGRTIYEEHCLRCHGSHGRGDGPDAPFLSPRPASLISAGTSAKPDADLLAVITNGKPRTAMPAWKEGLTEEQRRDVLAYIRTLIRFGPKPLTPPPP